MMYWLAENLVPHVSGFNLFLYVTARAVFAVLTALSIGLMLGPWFINQMKKSGRGQQVRDDGPERHLAKNNTPTMGGLLILSSFLLTTLIWADLSSRQVLAVLGVTVAFGLIGFWDDWTKISRKNSKGMSAKNKFLLQSAAALILLTYLSQSDAIAGNTDIVIPYMKDVSFSLGIVGFFVVGYFVIVGTSNAVNLTDGLDGLAIMPAVLIGGGLAVYAYLSGHVVFSDYLGLPHLPGTNELVIFCAALIGSGLAFLWFNSYPAQVFMGDIGSLAIGASLGAIAVMVRQEVVFFIMSGIFVVETMSVILQIGSYKLTGRRMFLMAPLHHHFELKGWAENQVVVRFWIITIVLVLFGLAGIKIR